MTPECCFHIHYVVLQHKITSVIHFASLKAVGVSVHTPLIYYKNNLGITINLLEVSMTLLVGEHSIPQNQ